MTTRLHIERFPEWARTLDKNLRAAAVRGLFSTALRLQQYITTDLIPREPRIPVDRGVYRAGWRAKPLPDGALLYNPVPHAPIVEWGARAESIKVGRKMIDALAEWVRRKGIADTTRPTRTGRTRKVKVTEKEARRIAWAIALSMKKRGIFNGGQGLRILERANKRAREFAMQEVTAELEKVRGGAR